jgi:hypothetical protein
VVLEVRRELTAIATQMADKHGEPPIDQQSRPTLETTAGSVS